ncbi:hypothetical protein T05_917 [Trichinella murrelli]|uniref:Uncharacterized protein n=1 Tax=Trichinella murrelli TaxID=144512 RepID=A0A0V0UFD8_9BILA|nr:hypothetical protein T05_917 [Trichinella murrelli]
MKENRLARNNEILHKTWQFQRIPHYNVGKHSYTKFQLSSIRFDGVSEGLLPLCIKIGTWQLQRPFIRHVRVCLPWNFPEPIKFSEFSNI